MFCKKVVLKNSAKFTGKHVYPSFFDKVSSLAGNRCSPVNLVNFTVSSEFHFPLQVNFSRKMCSSIEVSFIDVYNISYKFSKFFNSTFNDCNHLMVNPRPKGCLYEKKHPTYSLVNRMSRFAGMIFIFIYMRSFVLLCRDEFVTRYCFEFSSVWF